MTQAEPDRLEELFHAALALEPAARPAFLAQACGTDNALRAALENLLQHHQQAAFLSQPVWQLAPAACAPQPELPSDTQLGHYRIQNLLGKGGMGEVYLADDVRLGRPVALKVLPTAFAADAARIARFKREAKAASALNHPNILTIYEIGESAGRHFIAAELIAGVTLRARLSDGPLPGVETLKLVAQIADALAAAHQAGIVHRDIKPENVMVRPDGLVKVLDFGLASTSWPTTDTAQPASATPSSLQTDPGTVMGTPRYMSPEQARGLKVDARTDVFSLGALLYELLAGQPAFPGNTTAEVFAALLEHAPLPLTASAANCPAALDAIVQQALSKDPAMRYQTMREFAAALSACLPALAENAPLKSVQPALPAAHAASFRRFLRRHAKPKAGRVGGGLLLLTLALTAGWSTYQQFAKRTAPPPEAKFSPLIGLPGTKDYAAFSPDESRLAFAWDAGKNAQRSPRDIYIKSIGTDESPWQLTQTPADESMPVWSPDGRYVTFVRAVDGQQLLYRVPVQGGPEEALGETSLSCSWAPDGKTLAVISRSTASDRGSVFLFNTETGARTRLTTSTPPGSDEFPVFSPDGRQVAFIRLRGATESDVYVVSASGGPVRRITFDDTRINGVTWTADSRELVYGANRGSKRQLFRVPVTGGSPERVPVTGENPTWPTISKQGHRLAWTESLSDSNLYVYEGPGFAGHAVPGKFGPPRRLIGFSREDHSPEFSPDGQKLLFASGRAGGEDLWLCNADGSQPLRLTTQGGPTGTPHWSPDGQWLVFDSHTRGSADIYVMPFAGGLWRALTTEPSAEQQPAWSRDGRWVYFKSNRSGRAELWKVAATGGPARQLTFHGAFEGFEAPDGQSFYFTKGRGVPGIWTIPVEGGEENPIPELQEAGYWRSWGVLKEGLYFIGKEVAPQPVIYFFSFATRRTTPLVTLAKEPLWWQAGLALSPDGRRLVVAQMDYANDEIMLMENFR